MPDINLILFPNLVIGVAALSVAAAIIYALWGRKGEESRVAWMFALWFFSVGLARLAKALPDSALVIPVMAEVIAAAVCVFVAVAIWPVAVRSLSKPTYQELQDANAKISATRSQLEHSQKMFRHFMAAIPAISYLRNSDGTYLYVNEWYEHISGRSAHDQIGTKSIPCLSDELAELNWRADLEVLTTQQRTESVETYPMFDGQIRKFLVVRFPVSGELGETLVGGVAIDVTAQLQLQKTQAQLASIVECSRDAILSEDVHGTITSWNKGAEELYGFTATEAIGQSISIIVPPDRKHEIIEILDKIKRGIRVYDYETIRVCKCGKQIEVCLVGSPLYDSSGGVTGASLIARDISTLKTAQREIEKLNRELKARVYQLAESNAALQAARDQALESSNLKSAFVANISHELRTPLSGILGLNELLLSMNLTPEQWHLADMVHQSAQALVDVVNDILDLSKIEAGKVTLEYKAFNLNNLVEDCARLMAPTARNKGLVYRVEIDENLPEEVYGDATRVRQALLNLVGNAIKFTDKGSVRISVKLIEANEDSCMIAFHVTDTGIGIAPDQQRFLFAPFSQIDSGSTRKFGGTGLGLIISKQFVQMMKGDIGLNSEKGKGSLFWFCIPFDLKPLQQAQQFTTETMAKPGVEPLDPALTRGRRVLIVEDSAILQNLALRQLSSLGVLAEATVFGREAIELAMSGQYHLILMDVNLPDINGLEATSAIRGLENSAGMPHVPIIAMTAGAMSGDKERALSAGMDDYLPKPVSIQELKRMIEFWLAQTPVKTLDQSTHPIVHPQGMQDAEYGASRRH